MRSRSKKSSVKETRKIRVRTPVIHGCCSVSSFIAGKTGNPFVLTHPCRATSRVTTGNDASTERGGYSAVATALGRRVESFDIEYSAWGVRRFLLPFLPQLLLLLLRQKRRL